MSETDDTDELLLIPPDVFTQNLDNLGPYYNVVDCLITQVTQLENRINFIESSSEVSLSIISDSPEMQSPSKVRKFGEGSSSVQSTPQKPRTKFTVNSLPNTPDFERLKKSPQKRTTLRSKSEIHPMLGEIDHFLSKRLNTARNLESDFDSIEGGVNTRKLDINEVNAMLREVELRDKEKPCVKEKDWRSGDKIGCVPDYGYGMRKNMYPEPQKNSFDVEKTESESSSESTQMTAFENFKYKKAEEFPPNEGFNLGMVSLAKLWKSNDLREIPSKFQQKLQEERLRRQHCEQAIQDLQNRVLELQERVSVAIQVDEAKDKAIVRFHESWEKSGVKLHEIEKQKERLEEEVEKLRKRLNEDSDENNQKIAHYEKETSRALNIAQSSQDKIAELEKRCQELEVELKTSEINADEFQKKYIVEAEKNKQYPEILAQKELELNDCKTVLAEARKEISHSKRAVEVCQSELLSMKGENDDLQVKLDAEKENSKKISDQKHKILDEINAHKNIARGLQEELSKTREQLEKNKMELKNFYQGQVELVVQSKLKEFQSQLDEAEKNIREESSRKELSIVKNAASHIQQISEKHSLEIKLLEEKHQEQSRLYHLQIAQLHHELEDSNLKLKRQQEKHILIEQQLHKFMESLKQDNMNTPDEINSFRSKSFTNLEEILSFNMAEEERTRKAELDDTEGKIGETPVTSRNERGARRREGFLQETMQMLLEKRGEEGQAMKDSVTQLYQKLSKDMKGKPPWK